MSSGEPRLDQGKETSLVHISLSAILPQVASEFEFGIKENWDQINVITMEDRLDALE